MPRHAMIVHGYSENSLSAYAKFPSALKLTAPNLESVVLSAFNSLDDGVTIDDLADAFDGALVVRRWILNRVTRSKTLPSHLVTMAGANHGSSLAQLGRTPLGYAQKYLLDLILSVGARVLTDLDYGSAFLLKLSREWLFKRYGDGTPENQPDERLASLYAFSSGGDSLGHNKAVELLWASSERGCDNTVRISGANLNYTYLIADVLSRTLKAVASAPQPHLIVSGYSHYGPETGILAANTTPADAPMRALAEALAVDSDAKYREVLDSWSARNAAWSNARPDQAASTIVFSLHDRGGEQIPDSFIGFLDASVPGLDAAAPQADKTVLVQAMQRVSASIEAQQPIHNNVNRGSYSFYVNAAAFNAMLKHIITLEAKPAGSVVTFGPLNFTVDRSTVERLVFANQFTYVHLTVPRYADDAYALFDTTTVRSDPQLAWPPFDSRGRLA